MIITKFFIFCGEGKYCYSSKVGWSIFFAKIIDLHFQMKARGNKVWTFYKINGDTEILTLAINYKDWMLVLRFYSKSVFHYIFLHINLISGHYLCIIYQLGEKGWIQLLPIAFKIKINLTDKLLFSKDSTYTFHSHMKL